MPTSDPIIVTVINALLLTDVPGHRQVYRSFTYGTHFKLIKVKDPTFLNMGQSRPLLFIIHCKAFYNNDSQTGHSVDISASMTNCVRFPGLPQHMRGNPAGQRPFLAAQKRFFINDCFLIEMIGGWLQLETTLLVMKPVTTRNTLSA